MPNMSGFNVKKR